MAPTLAVPGLFLEGSHLQKELIPIIKEHTYLNTFKYLHSKIVFQFENALSCLFFQNEVFSGTLELKEVIISWKSLGFGCFNEEFHRYE